MNAYAALVEAWNCDRSTLTASPAFQLLASGRITRAQYAAILRQIFHHARENPQIQALATARFRGDQRDLVKNFLRHAQSEIGHDALALADIAALGEDTAGIRTERPLPATFSLLANAFYMIEHHNPLAYLGYLFQLEYTPVQVGPGLMASLEGCGIPKAAMTFLEEHATVDVAHCRLLQQYADKLIRTQEDLNDVLYMRKVTADGYLRMLEAAIAAAGQGGAFGVSPEEVCATGRDALASV
jgi:pyrroloquinoline quinone (PQQ) biosynthesis protein C